MIFFSVVIPTYNRIVFLKATIESVLSQTFQDFELVLVDDGSTDGTADMMQKIFANEPKINYIRKKNEERSIARNTGFKQAKGKFVVFFDSDDLMLPNHLATLHDYILRYPDVNFFATQADCLENGKIVSFDYSHLPEQFYDYRLLLQGNFFGTLICAKRENPHFQFFPPEFNICEDWIFNLRNLHRDRIFFINRVTMRLNQHAGRTMMDNLRVIEARLQAADFISQEINFSDFEKKQLYGYSYEFCAIHAYLEGNRSIAFRFLRQGAKCLGFQKKHFLLAIKILIGKKNIEIIKKILY